MWDLCTNALDTAKLRGASYGDVRVMHLRQRDLTTKNGQVGTLAQSESIGLGIRVLGPARQKPCPLQKRQRSRNAPPSFSRPREPTWIAGRARSAKTRLKFRW